MKRRHLFEFTDQPWLPRIFRSYLTELLAYQAADIYAPIAGKLAAALEASRATEVLDLCSGGGGPWRRLQPMLETLTGREVPVTLSDRFPPEAARCKKIVYSATPLDLNGHLDAVGGFCTIFSGLHHFKPDAASALLDRLASHQVPIGVFEFTERTWVRVTTMLFSPLAVWLDTPRVRPFRWGRLFFTYAVPVVPCLYLWDGLVSNLRSYSLRELERLAKNAGVEGYVWETGRVAQAGYSITFLLGLPLDFDRDSDDSH